MHKYYTSSPLTAFTLAIPNLVTSELAALHITFSTPRAAKTLLPRLYTRAGKSVCLGGTDGGEIDSSDDIGTSGCKERTCQTSKLI